MRPLDAKSMLDCDVALFRLALLCLDGYDLSIGIVPNFVDVRVLLSPTVNTLL